MRRLSIGLLVALLLVSRVGAQVTGPVSITVVDSGAACSVAAACANFQVGNAPSLTLQVSGTFVGTLTFEATADGTNWTAVGLVNPATGVAATTTTAAGQFALPNWGIVRVRVRATAFTSGSASVTMTRGVGTHLSAASGGGGGLPTAPINQVLVSQGVGVQPIFSIDLDIIGTVSASHVVIGNFNVVGGSIRLAEHAFSTLPIGTALGDLANFSDSTTKTPGQIVAGSGTFHVLARWNGANWICIGG